MIAAVSFAHPSELTQLLQTYTDDKHYNEVCWLTSHNSFAYADNSFSNTQFIRANQDCNIKEQLQWGVRGFMIDLYYEDDDPTKSIILAHSNPIPKHLKKAYFDPRYWNPKYIRYFSQKMSSPFLETIYEWLQDPKNSDDIITIHLESYVKSYKNIITEIQNAGLYDYLFDLKDFNGKWPTLGEMRKPGKRLVIFSDHMTDVGYGIMHTSNYMETDYDLNRSPNCEMRTDNRATIAPLLVMNSFYKWPSIGAATEANSYEKLEGRTCACFVQEKKWPNFIAVDYVKYKDARKIVLDINRRNINCPQHYIFSEFDNFCRKCTANTQLEFKKSISNYKKFKKEDLNAN